MKYTAILFGLLILAACDSGPKVIEADPSANTPAESPMMEGDASSPALVHKVVADEILNTSKYTYLHVTEDAGEPYWIAIPRKDVKTGVTYYYKGGLKKVNFKSVEHDRVFDLVYLVSDVSEDPAMAGLPANHPQITNGEAPAAAGPVEPPSGGIDLASLIAKKQDYAGKTVRVRGRVVKVNNMIMDRNWIHIQDGSGKGADLTVTTQETVPMGAVVGFEGRIAVNKDFGAGYKYEIILEDATLLP
jgi:hypothetical protein